MKQLNDILKLETKFKTPALVKSNLQHVPIIVDLDALTKKRCNYICRFPIYNMKQNIWSLNNVKTKSIYEVIQKIEDQPIIRQSDNWTFAERLNVLNHNKSCTFLFESVERFIDCARDVIRLSSKYKYNNTIYENIFNFSKPRDVCFLISFFKPEICFPIFKKQKVDGLCVAIEALNIKRSLQKKEPIFDAYTYIVFSKYKDNIFYVDGEQLLVPNTFNVEVPVLSDYIKHIKPIKKKVKKHKDNLVIKRSDYIKHIKPIKSTKINDSYFSKDWDEVEIPQPTKATSAINFEDYVKVVPSIQTEADNYKNFTIKQLKKAKNILNSYV
jgi:hypothetical protein